MRCPRCGNDNHPEEYVCTFCGARLRMEPIEKFPIFRRVEEKWSETKVETKTFKKLIMVIRNPSRAFWMITHSPNKSGLWMVVLLNAVLFGLTTSAIIWHTTFGSWSGQQITYLNFYWKWMMDFQVWLIFFLFGFIYYAITLFAWMYFYSLGANFAMGLKDIIKQKNLDEEEKVVEASAKGDKNYQSLVKQKKLKTNASLGYAMAPVLVANALGFLICLIALPIISISDTTAYNSYSGFEDLIIVYSRLFDSPVWGIIDFINIAVMIVWLPITVSIAIRDLAKTETSRVLISSVIVSILLAYVFFFLRPTLGWNLNLTDQYLT